MSAFHVKGKDFDSAAVPAGTTSLEIERIRKADLQRLEGLQDLPVRHLELRWLSAPDLRDVPFPDTLETLMVWHSAKVRSMAGIETARNLRELTWRKNVMLEDGSALRHLPHLRALSIEGDINGDQKIATLDFLEPLILDRLALNGVDGAKIDLSPVARMRQPRELLLNGRCFAVTEVAKVAAVNPVFYDSIMNLEDVPAGEMYCDVCPGQIKIMRLRGKKLFWCADCDRDAIERELQQFHDLVTQVAR